MAKEFPEIKEKNEGKFTKWVNANMKGMETCSAASKIMAIKIAIVKMLLKWQTMLITLVVRRKSLK